MCGIVGFVYAGAQQKRVSRELLQRMNERLIHRGPDDDGFFAGETVGLAMRRLAIIDLAGGRQPIHNQDRTKHIVFSGEIYNYRELKKDLQARGHRFETESDTEVIVHLYDRYGADCLRFLRGMFAFAIWDERDKSLFLARDRVGKKPLLYAHQPNGDLIFGSEFSALLEHPDVARAVDFVAIDNYLSYLCVPAPLTAFREIRKLEPAHWLRWEGGRIEMQRYWAPDFSKKIKISEAEAVEETTRILREAVKLRMIAEVPLGAFLSGGVDSSVVVALMAEESSRPLKTFSVGFEEEDFSELKYAKRVAEHVGAEYHEFIVRPDALEVLPTLVEHYGEPFADSSAIPTYYVARETRRYVTVALNGDGGDESFAGYERYAAMRAAEIYHRLPSFLRQALIETPVNLLPASEVKKSRLRDVKRFLQAAGLPRAERYNNWMSVFNQAAKRELLTREFAEMVADQNASVYLNKWFAESNGAGILDATLLTDQMTYLPNDLLVKVDIATMINSLEARSPLLDQKVIEFAASLPENLKMRRFETKSLLKRVAAELVPKDVIYRRKMGFGVPVGKWFRREMKIFLREILLSEKSLRRGIFKPEMIERYVREHTNGARDHAPQLWTLLMLELWFERFVD